MSEAQKPANFKIEPYFALSHSIIDIKQTFQDQDLTSDTFKSQLIKTGGRIIGRRKASKNLIFLDI